MNVHEISITTDASGDATVYSGEIRGRLQTLIYLPGTIATGGDLTITAETTLQPILTLTNAGTSNLFKNPRAITHDVEDGADSLYAAGNEVRDYIYLYNERVKIVVAQGGDTKTGTIKILTLE